MSKYWVKSFKGCDEDFWDLVVWDRYFKYIEYLEDILSCLVEGM